MEKLNATHLGKMDDKRTGRRTAGAQGPQKPKKPVAEAAAPEAAEKTGRQAIDNLRGRRALKPQKLR